MMTDLSNGNSTLPLDTLRWHGLTRHRQKPPVPSIRPIGPNAPRATPATESIPLAPGQRRKATAP
jgi:hypothetical protein